MERLIQHRLDRAERALDRGDLVTAISHIKVASWEIGRMQLLSHECGADTERCNSLLRRWIDAPGLNASK